MSEFDLSNLSLLNEESEHVHESVVAEEEPASPCMISKRINNDDSSESLLHESDSQRSLFSASKQRPVPQFSTGFFDDEEYDNDFQLTVGRNTSVSSELQPGQQQIHHQHSCSTVDDAVTVEASEGKKRKVQSQGKFCYLVTYSQADVLKVKGREEFARLVCEEFNSGGAVVQHWACAAETHSRGGVHFHLALKLLKRRRFAQVKYAITKKFDIVLDFKEWQSFYYDCFTYVKKQDKHYVTSAGHPALDNSPQTRGAVAAARTRNSAAADTADEASSSRTAAPKKPKKAPRLNLEHLYRMILAYKIRNDDDLCALVDEQQAEGKTDTLVYVMGKSEKQRSDIIATAWKIKNAKSVRERKSKTKLQLLQERHQDTTHDGQCNGIWLEKATELLQKNGLCVREFAQDIRNVITLGRGKSLNLMICGESDCGKSFLFMPLISVYGEDNVFMCPSNSTYNWVGAHEKDVIFLNDLNYSEETVMPWMQFLNLLEGAPIHVAVPKNHFAQDVVWSAKTPIFATCLSPIVRICGGQIHAAQTQMMNNRWKIHFFTYHIPNKVAYDPCGKCFTDLVLNNSVDSVELLKPTS